MSFKGEIEARCPAGCEPFATEVWSFIRGDRSPELRDAVLWRECNLLLCPECGAAFFPEAAYVYFEPTAELLAFVFPESYREKAEYWRGKMHEDFVAMKKSLGGELALIGEPEIFFGNDELSQLLEKEDFRKDESDVMEAVAAELGLPVYRVSRGFARREGVPQSLPYAPARKGDAAGRDNVLAGLEKVLAANDRLEAYAAFRDELESEPGRDLPPRAPRLS